MAVLAQDDCYVVEDGGLAGLVEAEAGDEDEEAQDELAWGQPAQGNGFCC